MKHLLFFSLIITMMFACNNKQLQNEPHEEDSVAKIIIKPAPPVIQIDSSCAELRVYPSMGYWWVGYRYKNQDEWQGFKKYLIYTHQIVDGALFPMREEAMAFANQFKNNAKGIQPYIRKQEQLYQKYAEKEAIIKCK